MKTTDGKSFTPTMTDRQNFDGWTSLTREHQISYTLQNTREVSPDEVPNIIHVCCKTVIALMNEKGIWSAGHGYAWGFGSKEAIFGSDYN